MLNLPDTFTFAFTSDELDGKAVHADGTLRPLAPRTLTVPSAINQNLESRVELGVHWLFDGSEGEKNGDAMAQQIVAAFPGRVP